MSVANVCTRKEYVGNSDLGLCLPVTEGSDACPASSASIAALWPLREDHAQLRVVSVFVDVVNTDMSLQIVRSGVTMLLIGTEWTVEFQSVEVLADRRKSLPNIPWALMNQAMPDHFILSLEPLSSRPSRAFGHWTEMRSIGRVYVSVTVEQVLGLERCCGAARIGAFEGTRSERSIWWQWSIQKLRRCAPVHTTSMILDAWRWVRLRRTRS